MQSERGNGLRLDEPVSFVNPRFQGCSGDSAVSHHASYQTKPGQIFLAFVHRASDPSPVSLAPRHVAWPASPERCGLSLQSEQAKSTMCEAEETRAIFENQKVCVIPTVDFATSAKRSQDNQGSPLFGFAGGLWAATPKIFVLSRKVNGQQGLLRAKRAQRKVLVRLELGTDSRRTHANAPNEPNCGFVRSRSASLPRSIGGTPGFGIRRFLGGPGEPGAMARPYLR